MDRITLTLGERSRVVRIRADQEVEVHIEEAVGDQS